MCDGVYYSLDGEDARVYFSSPGATLPARTRNGGIRMLAWGRRNAQVGQLPLGGWAHLDAIYTGRWDRWFPKPVQIPIRGFMERDLEDRRRWYELTRGQWVQGLIARCQHERRIYIVTLTPVLPDAIHHRWPRIMSG